MQEKEQKVSPIKQRILFFADTLGISKRDFYIKIGVSRGTLESKTGITEDVMAKFIATYPQVNTEWLITGRGNMVNTMKDNIPTVIKTNNIEEGIPLIPINAQAGVLRGEVSIMEYECEHYIVPAFKDADFLITVHGDSMRPHFESGDIVACRRITDKSSIQWNMPYVIDTNQGVLVKRIYPTSDSSSVLIVSDNRSYPPFTISLSDIYSIALVVGVIRIE